MARTWRHSEDVKTKIQVLNIIRKLQACVLEGQGLSREQIQSAKILLDKVMPNAPTILEGSDGPPIRQRIENVIVDPKD